MNEPFYMKFVRRSQEKKRAREKMLASNISATLKSSIGYLILLRMGWCTDGGLGKNKDGKVSISGLIKTKRRGKCPYQLNQKDAEEEYKALLKEAGSSGHK
ncbi:uncharacterized protein NEMAJ01_1074 [Nematocida major]|uniref:uncharacterized protein n=1 Tax=Nematocida major TaxID=1912982 RepID=UPI0020082095|nr:uncharacterized protein NEMAJ01_1074 [Nematocida major]KAH9386178.1 hypothetical protein NEMAJ01_1074 [Nematocida major]